MYKGRLEAFSDGVIAIIITIMVLQLNIPNGSDLAALRPLTSTFFSYVLSFINVGIYWSNHHHLFQAVRQVNGHALLANLNLLFWLSLLPFATTWMGKNGFAALPVAIYGVILLLAGVAYFILTHTLVFHHGKESTLANAMGRDFKGKLSLLIYAVAIPLAFINAWLACALYVVVSVMWLIPDLRIEKTLNS